jgi:hypothetical protein
VHPTYYKGAEAHTSIMGVYRALSTGSNIRVLQRMWSIMGSFTGSRVQDPRVERSNPRVQRSNIGVSGVHLQGIGI